MIVQEPVQAAIWHCLNHYAYADAIFLAERLYAELESEESVFLLGTCYYRTGRVNEAFWLLSNAAPTTPNARFLLARCAFDLEKLSEAEIALNGVDTEFGDVTPFALQLLARLYSSTERKSKSADCHRKALSLNPFLWDSFARLCRSGEKADPEEIFQLSNVKNLSACLGGTSTGVPPPIPELIASTPNRANLLALNGVTPVNNPQILPTATGLGAITPDSGVPVRKLRSLFGAGAASPLTPSFGILPLEESPLALYAPTLTDANEQKALPKLVHNLRAHVGQLKEAVFSPGSRQTHAGPPRRSSRIFSNSYSVKENNKSPNRKFAAPKSPSRKSKHRLSKVSVTSRAGPGEVTDGRPRDAADRTVGTCMTSGASQLAARQSSEGLMALMRSLGEAFRRLASLECRRALALLDELPPRQHRSPWVRTLFALAHHELGEYEPAARYFAEVRAARPLRTEHLDTYSTCLWHLQREVELSALARELVSRDRRCATAWLVAGNCFSLHKEHDAAVRFFKRAIQLRPDRPYAHTLLGHEYVATEETDKAMACFRSAVKLDPRHYNAWFGIATVYSKQERFKLAEVHFRRAVDIHPESGVLRCHLGVVQVALGKAERALDTLNGAVAVDPKNPLCRFHRASVLFSAGRLTEALEELEDLKDAVPKESLVYYLLGKVHNKLGDSHLALMHFSWATDLDPKGASGHIKEAFEPARADDAPDSAL